MNVSRIISAVIDSRRNSSSSSNSPFHETQVQSSKDAQPNYHDFAQVLHGGCTRAQPREAQISLWSKYECWVLDRQPKGCNGTSGRCRLVDPARSISRLP